MNNEINKKIFVGLLSHYFVDSNLGCVALSICNLLLIDKAASELGYSVEYIILVNEKIPQVPLNFTNSKYEYRVYSSSKETLKHPIRLMKTKIFEDCDFVFNLCAGDGFTDIYGKWRTFSESYMTILGSFKNCKMILAPQTIGPFNSKICRQLARFTMNRCDYIFVRDNPSYKLCEEMGQSDKTKEVIDVALALPYTKQKLNSGFNFGINVSGLLYNDDNNRFQLSFDYKEFIERLVSFGLDQNFNIHLISHVNIETETGEDDYIACKEIHKKYPQTILVDRFESPIDAKNYISGLDLFSGARMHATIAAISSDIPVIPVAYSRKVNGLYGNLNYPYYIDAKNKDMSIEKAINQFQIYMNNINEIKETLEKSKVIYTKELTLYVEEIKNIFHDYI